MQQIMLAPHRGAALLTTPASQPASGWPASTLGEPTVPLQVTRMGQEKMLLQKEKSSLQRTVTDLAAGVERINREKVQLESQLEMEEEGIVNRMNR